MKYLTILYICALALWLSSCSESTTNPNTNNNTISKVDLLTKYFWEFKSSDNGKTPEIAKIKFNKDGSYTCLENDAWINGTWTIDSAFVNIKITDSVKTDSLKLVSVSDLNLIVKANINSVQTSLTYIPIINNSAPLQINGSITFMPDVTNQDLSKAKVAVMWLPQTEDGDPVIWGIGTVNAASKTFSITVDNSVPMSIFMPLSGKIDGYINIGFIMLFWDDNLHNGQTMTVEQFLSSQIGLVEDRSIIYLKGDYKSWNLDFLINDFSQGYNYCKGWYTTQTGTNDGWQVTPDHNNQLLKVVSSGIGLAGFKMPNWN